MSNTTEIRFPTEESFITALQTSCDALASGLGVEPVCVTDTVHGCDPCSYIISLAMFDHMVAEGLASKEVVVEIIFETMKRAQTLTDEICKYVGKTKSETLALYSTSKHPLPEHAPRCVYDLSVDPYLQLDNPERTIAAVKWIIEDKVSKWKSSKSKTTTINMTITID